MKKLMIMAAVTIMAVATQAASITWSARNMYIPVATDVAVSQTGIVPTSGSKFGDTSSPSLLVSLYWVNNAGENVTIGDFSTTGAGVISSQTLGNGTTSDLYLAMVADQGSTWKPEYYFTATYETSDGRYVYEGSVTSGTAIGDLASKAVAATANFSTAGSWDYTAKAIPEPTSGLLFLLGMAGLALRRRRA